MNIPPPFLIIILKLDQWGLFLLVNKNFSIIQNINLAFVKPKFAYYFVRCMIKTERTKLNKFSENKKWKFLDIITNQPSIVLYVDFFVLAT